MKSTHSLRGKLLIIACLLSGAILPTGKGYGQSATDLPKIIPPSPEAAALFRYLDYPVDYSTGLPQISIPVYDVKSGSLDVPISLSYHASGRRVGDQDGAVALGWNLNAGGTISRTIYGSVDFGTTPGTYKFPYPFNTTNLTNSTDYVYLEKIAHFDKNPFDVPQTSWMDSEYDIFSYSFGNNSGKFFFRDSNSVKIPTLLPYKPYVITPYYTQFGLTAIDIVDDKGVLYKFLGSDTYQNGLFQPITGYNLSRIISADKTDTIAFVYTGFNQTRTNISQQIILADKDYITQTTNDPILVQELTSNETTTHDPYQTSRLTEIDFRQGKVLFNLVAGSDKIDNIQVKNYNNEIIKTVQVYRSYMDNLSEVGYATNKLDSLVFKGDNSTAYERYGFDYYPSGGVSSPFNVRYRDWWGYYNNSGVHDIVPYYTNLEFVASMGAAVHYDYSVGNPAFRRDPNLQGLEWGMLKKITYPTGGNSVFTYENNQYYSYKAQQVRPGPGMRIAQISATDNNGNVQLKTYRYGVNESGYGTLDMEPDITNMSTEYTYNYYSNNGTNAQTVGHYRQRVFSSEFNPELSAVAERPVVYSEVAEYRGDGTNNAGKTIYNYDYAGWAPSGMPAFESMTLQRMHIYNYNYWNNPMLTRQRDYKTIPAGGSPSYQLRREIDNTYSVNVSATVNGLHVQRIHNFPQSGTVLGTYPPPALYCEPYGILMDNPLINAYTYSNYQIPVGYKNLAMTSETLYNDDNTAIATTTAYNYNANQFVSQTTRNTSDGGATIKQITYPADYTGNTVLTQMVGANMLNYPIEQNEFKNSTGTPVKGTRTNYFNWGSTVPLIAPQTIDVKQGTNAYETRLHFYSYDSYGNPLSVSKETDTRKSYIWDYKNTNPIAEASNTDPASIAYTSFEADGLGGWTMTPASTILYGGVTGKYCFSGTLNKTFAAAGNFIVRLWSLTGGNATVNGQTGTALITRGNYQLLSWTLNNVSSIQVVADNIDEVRAYPSTAQMSTYTYKPLVGMTSSSDANDRINYYEYDELGRLILVRDQDKNIVKKICYNYAGQAQSCQLFYNQQQSTAFTRSCAAGYAGTQVTYTIPAGTYSSTNSQAVADQSATNDMTANGQNYANAHGACNFVYYNAAASGSFTRSCPANNIASTVTYTVAANTYSSIISQADANQKAQNDVTANGQNYANAHGTCTPVYYNVAISGSYQRKNCTSCQWGSSVIYTIAAGTYSSTVSQAAADLQAQNDMTANGQNYANAHGTCSAPPTAGINGYNGTTANVYMTFSNTCTGGTYSYTLNSSSSGSFGPLPSGTYNVYMSSTGTHTFSINGASQSSSSYVNFSGVVINGGASVSVY